MVKKVLFSRNKTNLVFLPGERFFEIFKFGITGGLNTGLSYTIFCILAWLNVPLLLASFASYLAGMIQSFLLNKFWTFRHKDKINSQQVFLFVLVNFISFLVNYFTLLFFTKYIGLNVYLAQIAAIFFSLICNFTGTKFFVFSKKCKQNCNTQSGG